jgi:phage gpG-like protein
MTIRLTLDGTERLQAALRDMSDDLRGAVNKVVLNEGMRLRGEVVGAVESGPASGRVYQKYNPRRAHRASAPGQAPMTDTGRLASRIYFNQETVGGNMVATVGSVLAYAAHLEYGTLRMAARPYFRPAIERRRPKFVRNLERAIAGEIR